MNTYSLSRWVYLAGMVLVLAFVLPVAWFPFGLGKVAMFSICAAVASGLFVWSGQARGLVRSRGFMGALLVGLLPFSYLLSFAFSADRSVGLMGYGLETDTLVFTILCALTFILSFGMMKTLRGEHQLLSVLFWTLTVVTAVQAIAVVIGPGAFFGLFPDPSANLIGKWNDLGILSSLLLLLVMIRLEWSGLSKTKTIVSAVFGVVLVLLLGIINFPVAWVFILAGSIVLAVMKFLINRGIPYYAIAGSLLGILFLFFGSAFNSSLTSLFPVSSLEVRPSYSSTLQVLGDARGSSIGILLVGTGPNTFGEEWLLHKPSEVNQSQFWNLDFNVGYSTFMTALGSVGLLGLLGWLVAPLLLIAGLIRAIRQKVLSREDTGVVLTLSFATILLFAATILYVPSQNLVLLAFILSGAAYAFLLRQGQPAQPAELSRMWRTAAIACSVILVVGTVGTALAVTRMTFAESINNQGLIALQGGKADQAYASAQRAAHFGLTPTGARLMVDAQNAQLQALAATTTNSANLQQVFASKAQSAILAGQAAVAKNVADYRTYMALGNVYAFLSTLKIGGATESARAAFAAAGDRNPKSPSIAFTQAQLEASAGNAAGLQTSLTKALTLKPDYTDAILMVVQLSVAQGDLNTAVQAATAAVKSAPGVPSLWFELGALYYSGRDAKDAVPVLEQAVTLQADYANAKYFLGLAYWANNQKPQAIQQFQDLAKTNPGNAEVAATLEAMTSGKQPQYPNPPQKTAPIK